MKIKSKEWLLTIFTGLLGAVVGIVATSYMNLYTHKKQQQYELTVQSFKFDSMDKPTEFIDIKQLIDEMRNLSIMDAESIRESARLISEYPHCTSTLSEECRIFMVKSIQITRKELGSGKVSEKDIDTILKPKYIKAERAFKKLNKK